MLLRTLTDPAARQLEHVIPRPRAERSADRPSLIGTVPPPSAILFDVGGTVLQELRVDLEAGMRAVLTSWLIEHVQELRGSTVDHVEDAMWREVVTLVPTAGVEDVLRLLIGDGVRIGAVSNASFSGRVLERELHRHGLGEYLRHGRARRCAGVSYP